MSRRSLSAQAGTQIEPLLYYGKSTRNDGVGLSGVECVDVLLGGRGEEVGGDHHVVEEAQVHCTNTTRKSG